MIFPFGVGIFPASYIIYPIYHPLSMRSFIQEQRRGTSDPVKNNKPSTDTFSIWTLYSQYPAETTPDRKQTENNMIITLFLLL
ncbi:MAG: hypothetical protein CSA81_13175 [Acidobacteria bacterium]|nr:MAG: hypothetical protein CSA81_13175 [Acidobacteriota bacterium]